MQYLSSSSAISRGRGYFGRSAASSLAMMSLHSATHSSQMNTRGPEISLRTSRRRFPQNEQWKSSIKEEYCIRTARRQAPSRGNSTCRTLTAEPTPEPRGWRRSSAREFRNRFLILAGTVDPMASGRYCRAGAGRILYAAHAGPRGHLEPGDGGGGTGDSSLGTERSRL